MAIAKRRTSSFLDPNFSVEDISYGLHSRRTSSGKGIDLVNKMGLLSSLNDIHNTDPTNFAIEATRLQGESDLFGNYVNHALEEINYTYRTLVTVKQRYGIERLDPYKFSQEGIGEALKTAWNAIVAAFKKLILAIMNIVRSIVNYIGSKIAEGQEKLVDEYNDIKTKSNFSTICTKAKKIKCILPTSSSKAAFNVTMEDIKKLISEYTDKVPELEKVIDESTKDSAAMASKPIIENGKFKGRTPGHPAMSAAEKSISMKIDKAIKEAMKAFENSKLIKKGGKITDPKHIVNMGLYGKAKPDLRETPPNTIITAMGIDFISKEHLEKFKDLIGELKNLVKELNSCLKSCIAASKNAEKFFKGEKGEDNKAAMRQHRANRKALQALSWERNIAGVYNGMVICFFGAYLRTRGYVAASVKSLMAADKELEKKEDKK